MSDTEEGEVAAVLKPVVAVAAAAAVVVVALTGPVGSGEPWLHIEEEGVVAGIGTALNIVAEEFGAEMLVDTASCRLPGSAAVAVTDEAAVVSSHLAAVAVKLCAVVGSAGYRPEP